MSHIFLLLFFLTLICLISGLFKPRLVIRWGAKRTRKQVFLFYGLALFIFFMLVGITAPDEEARETQIKQKEDSLTFQKKNHSDNIEWLSLPLNTDRASSDEKRVAVILDKKGIVTEVESLSVSIPIYSNWFADKWRQDCIIIITIPKECLIPFKNLITLNMIENDSCQVLYEWNGTEHSVSGLLKETGLKGSFDFGEFRLNTSQTRQLTFKKYPAKIHKVQPAEAILNLYNGDKIKIGMLKRHAHYYSTSGYIVGGTWRDSHSKDIHLSRGEAFIEIPFNKINQVTFNSVDSLTVTDKSGKQIKGALPKDHEHRLTGMTGISNTGPIYIHQNMIKNIQFIEDQP